MIEIPAMYSWVFIITFTIHLLFTVKVEDYSVAYIADDSQSIGRIDYTVYSGRDFGIHDVENLMPVDRNILVLSVTRNDYKWRWLPFWRWNDLADKHWIEPTQEIIK